MDLIQAILLALVQGLTEFLPISSTAHLVLVPVLFGWQDQGLAFDVAVHVGTLGAVVLVFRADFRRLFAEMSSGTFSLAEGSEFRLVTGVLLATLPAAAAGLFFGDFIEANFRGPLTIAVTTIGFALLLWVADWRGRGPRTEHSLSWRGFLLIGCAQAVALIPGTSRSGITMTLALFLGLSRSAAARLSFLMSIPAILLAAVWASRGLSATDLVLDPASVATAVVVSFLSAWATIRLFLALLERIGFLPFVIYRLLLGGLLLTIFVF